MAIYLLFDVFQIANVRFVSMPVRKGRAGKPQVNFSLCAEGIELFHIPQGEQGESGMQGPAGITVSLECYSAYN